MVAKRYVNVHVSVRAPRERNVAAQELAIQNSLNSATLWGGVGGGKIRHCSQKDPHELARAVNQVASQQDLSAHEIGLASDTDHKRRSAETETQPRSEFTGGCVSVAATPPPDGRRLARPTVRDDALLAEDLIHRTRQARGGLCGASQSHGLWP
jgi:hypothetical protein